MTNVLAVDPGGTTGLSSWRDGVWRAWIVALPELTDVVETQIRLGLDLLVYEDFLITAATVTRSSNANETIEAIGVGRHLAKRANVPFETQRPGDARAFGTRHKLDTLGWHTKGPDHADSASRHLLLALARHREIDLRQIV